MCIGEYAEWDNHPKAKKEIAERYQIREKFWTQLLETAKEKSRLHANKSPNRHNWLGASAGKQGLGFNYSLRKNEAQVELYLDRGKEKEDENIIIFEKLVKEKEAIEKSFGDSLEWDRLETRRACRIRKIIREGGCHDAETKWTEIHASMVEAMI